MRYSVDVEDMKFSLMEGKVHSDVGVDIPVTGRASLSTGRSSSSWKTNGTMRVAFVLTMLQFSFAMYATFLLYWLSPAVPDLHGDRDTAIWTNHISKIGKIFPTSYTAQVPNRVMMESSAVLAVQGEPKSAVCVFEDIAFPQKKSNNTKMIGIKTGLFR